MKKPIFLSLLFISIVFAISNISAQWQSEVRLTNDPTSSFTSFGNARCIAVNGDVIHVVWYDGVTVGSGDWEVYYKRSTDKGLTWSGNVNLSNNGSISYNPAIAVSGSYVHVAWYDNRDGNWKEYYKRSIDGGITWGPEIRLTNDNAVSGHCSITASGLNVHLVWYDTRDGNYEIYYKQSTNGGDNWSADLRLSNTVAESWNPAVAVSGSNVHVVWYDLTPGNSEIYYIRSTNGGVNWGVDTRLTNNTYESIAPTLAVSGSIVHIAWADSRNGSYNIYYKKSANGGLSWGSDTRLTKSNYFNNHPSLAVNGKVVHLVFYRLVTTSYDIFYKTSKNDGGKWANDLQLTNDPDASSVPSVAVSGSDVHTIFRDGRDGNSEIYYKRYLYTSKGKGKLEGITNINPEIHNEYSLSQNYPNPFNPVTKISFNIPKQGFVSIKIYNELGLEVASLVNKSLSPGTYEATFDAMKYSSGVYFYKLEAGDFVETKRMMLIK